jgi:hypothetical protein
MRSIMNSCRITLMLFFCLALIVPGQAAGASEPWDGLLEISYKFNWYPRQDLQRLLEVKAAEYGQSLPEYRDQLLREITGGGAPARIDPGKFRTGLPWRKYYRLSMAEYNLFLISDRTIHLQNAVAALSVLAKKTGQPEIEFWNYVYGAHLACEKRDRAAFVAEIYRIWQNVLLRFEMETLLFPNAAAQTGFVRNLPFLYETVVHLVTRRAIVEKEIPNLYPLGAVIIDIQSKLSIENGHKAMLDQLVERMHGVNSDNGNLNFAVALLEATATRYDFEDEKDEARLAAKYNLTKKYYQLAYNWADTDKGRAAILSHEMGFMNYLIRRYSNRPDLLLTKMHFNNAPALANNALEKGFTTFDRLAALEMRKDGYQAEGFEDRETYLQSMHQLLDSTAKLAIVLSDFYLSESGPEPGRNIFPAARPLQQYCALFARHAAMNSEILPDNAYFLAAYAARDLAGLYREHTRYSTDDRASALAFAYQLQAAVLFPLDLPGILQLAFQSTLDGRVREYFEYSNALGTRLRTSTGAAGWPERNPGDFAPMIALVPSVVPEVIENAFTLLRYFPEGETSEEVLFGKAVKMARTIAAVRTTESQEKIEAMLRTIGGREGVDAAGGRTETGGDGGEHAYFELKSQLYASPNNPVHTFLRTLFHEIPYEDHPYVPLMRDL